MMEQKNSVFDRLERFYLSALRIFLLVCSTLLFGYALATGMASLYGVMRTADNVEEAKPSISPTDIIPNASPSVSSSESGSTDTPAGNSATDKSPFEKHTDRMFEIWAAKFEIYRKSVDPKLTSRDFSEWYNGAWQTFDQPQWCSEEECTDAELQAFEEDLQLAETTIRAAAEEQTLRSRMASAVSGGSDAYDRTFVDLNTNFWRELTNERNKNRAAAEAERAEIAAANVAGGVGLISAGWAFGAFISLMFGFLLVAVERHQRKMAHDLDELKSKISEQ